MAGAKIAAARAAAEAFLRAAPADVYVGLASVATKSTLLVRPTRDHPIVEQALSHLHAAGKTHLYDGIDQVASALGSGNGGLLVVLSDGADTGSHDSLQVALQEVGRTGVTLDSIGFQTTAAQHAVLTRLAAAGAGRVLSASGAASLAKAFRSTTQDLVSRMTLRMRAPAALAGRALPLTVTVPLPSGDLTDTSTILLAAKPQQVGGTPGQPATQPVSSAQTPVWDTGRGLGIGLAAIFLALVLLPVAFSGGPFRLSGGPFRRHHINEVLSHYSRDKAADAQPADQSALGGTGLMRGALSVAQRLIQKEGREEKLALLLERAGVRLRPNEWLVVRGLAVLLSMILLALLGHSLIVGIILGVPIGLAAPPLWLSRKVRKRRTAFLDRLPDSLQLVAGSLSAGYSLLQALDGVVQEGEEPIAGEFSRALATARLGVPIEDALDQVAERVDSPDFAWTAMAIRIQREVGGNLAEVLLTVGDTLRERAALRRQVRALSAEGRLSAYILLAIPTLFGMYEVLLRRSYVSVMWSNPIGIALMVATIVLMGVGFVWMRNVVNVEV
jgi:tight adherence protein B